jgi:hypothetical protein
MTRVDMRIPSRWLRATASSSLVTALA